jgi:hypothetical protein
MALMIYWVIVMATFRKCSVCAKKVLEHTECECVYTKDCRYYNNYLKYFVKYNYYNCFFKIVITE